VLHGGVIRAAFDDGVGHIEMRPAVNF